MLRWQRLGRLASAAGLALILIELRGLDAERARASEKRLSELRRELGYVVVRRPLNRSSLWRTSSGVLFRRRSTFAQTGIRPASRAPAARSSRDLAAGARDEAVPQRFATRTPANARGRPSATSGLPGLAPRRSTDVPFNVHCLHAPPW